MHDQAEGGRERARDRHKRQRGRETTKKTGCRSGRMTAFVGFGRA